jgi:adenosylcobinamide-GDP ribazoletransferase
MSGPGDCRRHFPGFFTGFAAATAFFTTFPVGRSAGSRRLADAAWAFPLVGAGIGAVAGLAFLFGQVVGLGDWSAALLSVLSGIALTGALHEDGLADTADGFLGGRDREAKLAIMRDSRLGAFGVLAIVLSVLLRVASLASIGDAIHVGLALIAAHAVSRGVLPVAMWAMSPARADGLGATAGTPRGLNVLGAATIGILIGLAALGPPRGAIAICLTGMMVLAIVLFARRQIGGYTGDVLGAFQQIGEIVMLLAASAR